MSNEKDIDWFKREIQPLLKGFEVEYKFFENGDFGSLNQVEFNSSEIGGGIDFWGLDWLGIFLWDYKREIELMNVLLSPDETLKKEEAVEQLMQFLCK